MMRRSYHLAVLGCSLPFIEAGSFKWNSREGHDLRGHAPAQETAGLGEQMLPAAAVPAPTSPPELRRSPLGKRLSSVPGSVCGYLSHDISSPLACATDNTCIFTTTGFEWMAGCCPTTSTDCPVVTTCIDSAAGYALGSDEIGISTYWCSLSQYPVCVTLTYEDVVGYTIFNCGGLAVETLQAIDHSLAVSSTASSADDTTTSSSTLSNFATTTDGLTSTTSTASSTHTSTSKSSTPIGAIVGGVVGGVAVIAILVFSLVFLLCRKKRSSGPALAADNVHAAPQPVAGAPAPAAFQDQPAMQQPYSYAGVQPGVEDRNSIQKPPYSVNTQSIYGSTLNSPGSPPPLHSPAPGSGTVPSYQQSTQSPPLQENQGFPQTESSFHPPQQNTAPAQAFQEYQQHDTMSCHEMPATKPDRELRELP